MGMLVRVGLRRVVLLMPLLVSIASGQAQQGFSTVVTNTVGGNATFKFDSNFGLENLTTEKGTATQTFAVPTPGNYHVTEKAPKGWDHPPIATCTKGKPDDIVVDADKNTTCTFTNVLPNPTHKQPNPILCDSDTDKNGICTLTRFDRHKNEIGGITVGHVGFDLNQVWAINGSKVLCSGAILSAPGGTNCSDNDWKVVLLSRESSSILIYGPADISEYCGSAPEDPETPRVLLVVPVSVIWAQVFHYDGNLNDPVRKAPAKTTAPDKYCGATVDPSDPGPRNDDPDHSKPGGIRPCDADSKLMHFFYKDPLGRSWGWIYNPLTQPGTSQGTISFSPAIGPTPRLCTPPPANYPTGCIAGLKVPTQSLNYDVQLYPSRELGPGWIGLPVIFEKATTATANFDSLSVALSYDFRLDATWSWSPTIWRKGDSRSPLERFSIRPPEFLIRYGPEMATAKPHDINLVAGATVRVPFLFDIHSHPSALSIFPVAGIEAGNHIHAHLTETDGILRKVVGFDASLRVPYIVTHAFLGDKPIMADFSWRTRYLSYPEPFTDYVSGVSEALTKWQRSYWRGDFIVPVSTLVQFKVTVLHGGLPPDFDYLGYNRN